MSAQVKATLEKLVSELAVSSCCPDTSTTPLQILGHMISETNINKFYDSLHSLPVSPDCYCLLNALLLSVTELNWLLPDVLQGFSDADPSRVLPEDADIAQVKALFEDVAGKLCHHAAVKTLRRETECFSNDDARGISERALNSMMALNFLIQKLDCVFKQFNKSSLNFVSSFRNLGNLLHSVGYKALFICLEHMSSSNPWTSEESVRVAKDLLATICSADHCSSFAEYLARPTGGVFTKVLSDLQPKLKSSSWKLNPSAPYIFSFCVFRVRMPYLSDHLGTIFHIPLLFADDFELSYNELGLQVIQHIIDNVSHEELCWYGRANVLYDLLYRKLQSEKGSLIKLVIPCTLSILEVVETSPRSTNHMRQEGKYDEVFCTFLQNMYLEETVVLRRIYASHLPIFIEKIGITVVRHLDQLLQVIASYLEVYDGPQELCRLDTLEALRVLLREAWPRMANHCPKIFQNLVRLIYEMTTDSTSTPADVVSCLMDSAVRCLKLLDQVCPGQVQQLLRVIVDLDTNDTAKKHLMQVLNCDSDV